MMSDNNSTAADSWETEAAINPSLSRLNVNAPVFIPNVNAPEFVPSFLKDSQVVAPGN